MPIITDPRHLCDNLTPERQKIIALDLGRKTIGLALSDTRRKIATPLTTLTRRKFTADAAALEVILAEEGIGAMLIGLPLNMNNTEGPRAQASRAFADNLLKRPQNAGLPVGFWDERLSTRAVTRTLLEANTSRAKRTAHIDKMAACYILQGYLDFLNETPDI